MASAVDEFARGSSLGHRHLWRNARDTSPNRDRTRRTHRREAHRCPLHQSTRTSPAIKILDEMIAAKPEIVEPGHGEVMPS
jgi:hypothetical protein